MLNIILITLMIYGVSNIIAHSYIFEWFRKLAAEYVPPFYDLITCMMCLPFWFGCFAYLFYKPQFPTLDILFLDTLVYGLFTSGVVWFIHTTQEFLERR